jgi:predicted FMN-binding regulatory protein PaiB
VYLPEHFVEGRQDEIDSIIEQNPLGTLMGSNIQRIDVDHRPLLLAPGSGPQDVFSVACGNASCFSIAPNSP